MNWRDEIEALAKGALGDDGETVVDAGMGIGYSSGSEEARKDILRLLRVLGEAEAKLKHIHDLAISGTASTFSPSAKCVFIDIKNQADNGLATIVRGSDEQSQTAEKTNP